jgi:glycogen synthase
MRILLLTYEYPPVVHGGLGRHVDALSTALARAGHEVHVLTSGGPPGTAPAEELREDVHVHRVADTPPVIPADDWIARVLAFDLGLQAAAFNLLRDLHVDLIHAHDWLVAYPAAAVKAAFGLPLVATVHATEYGRHQGWLPGPMNRYIHQVEWWLTYEARRVITCSRYQHDQAQRIFQLPPDKLDVVPNGVTVDEFRLTAADEVADTRAEFLAAPDEQLLLFAGRLEYEKGVQTLLRAVRRLRRGGAPVRLVCAGDGTYRPALEQLARDLRIRRAVHFTGFLDRAALVRAHRAADIAVVPSIYEPFGIVALEAMAAGTPLVVADTGGLAEVVDHGRTGLRVAPEDVGALTGALRRLLGDPRLGRRLAATAHDHVTASASWDVIAARTAEIYERAITQERELAALAPAPLQLAFARSPLLQGLLDA